MNSKKYYEAVVELGYAPLQYHAREFLKRTADLNAVEGALQWYRARFDRSLDAAIENGYWQEHPTFPEYIRMLDLPRVPQKIRDQIESIFSPYIPDEIKRRDDYWYPPEIRKNVK